jgi:hypothetical protein
MAFWFQRTQHLKLKQTPTALIETESDTVLDNGDVDESKRQPGKSYADAVKEPPSQKSKSKKPRHSTGSVSSPGRLLSFILGSPSDLGWLNVTSVAINALLLFSCLYFQFYPVFFNAQHDLAFARVGATGDTWVKMVARVPPKVSHWSSNDTSSEVQSARVIYRLAKPRGKWLVGPEFEATDETDWVGHVRLDSLYPATEYECRLCSYLYL